MGDEFKNADFFNDKEKMKDFTYLTKEEFLSSYSYLTEDEYNNTYNRYYAKQIADVLRKFAEKPQNIDNLRAILKIVLLVGKKNLQIHPKR